MKIQAHSCFFRSTVDKAQGTCHTPQNEDDVTLPKELLASKGMPPSVPRRGHLWGLQTRGHPSSHFQLKAYQSV